MKKSVICILLACAVFLGGLAPVVSFAASDTVKTSAHEKVNLNRADLEQLQSLPGVGPALAERIIDYRKNHGPFASVEQLVEVKGIGERKLEKLKGYLVL